MSTLLQKHIAALRIKAASSPVVTPNLVFWGTAADKPHLARLKGCVGSVTTYTRTDSVHTLSEVALFCASKMVTKVVTTNITLLMKLLHWTDTRKKPSLYNYAGSYFLHKGIEYVFIQPLPQLRTVSYGQFMAKRIISKLIAPDLWLKPSEFNWHVTKDFKADYDLLASADLIALDIETLREPVAIRCISYCAYWYATGKSLSIVFPIDSEYNLAWMRKFNNLAVHKIMQNGKYDISYCTRYHSPVRSYMYDTAHLFHSWYSELPKDLGFLNSFFVRESMYWKDLSKTNDTYEYYRYNCLDTWGTLNCFLAIMHEAPDWALDNYVSEFPLVFPCHLAEMTGIARDFEALDKSRVQQQAIVDTANKSLDTMLGVTNFNVMSPPQMKQLLSVLGCKDLPSTDEKNLRTASDRHPVNQRILDQVITVRKARKLVSTYLTKGKEFGDTGRILYSLNPHGTDTSRLASAEHPFWCGFNIQNIVRGPIVKQSFKADAGFLMYECDLAQAESRDTAYISGDANLIYAVEESPDFHSYNASRFFGTPFEQIFDALTGKVLLKTLRQLSKPVNHGANYNMQANTLISTMGMDKVRQARELLKLPKHWSLKQVASHLLDQFHLTYPGIKKNLYAGVVEEILRTGHLQHKLVGEKGLVRRCFGNPTTNFADYNSYIAHQPQSLNARTLNKAWLQVFTEVAIPNPYDFRLNAQVHDSILFQARLGSEHLLEEVRSRMEIPVTITAYDGVTRTFTVPADTSKGGLTWADCK